MQHVAGPPPEISENMRSFFLLVLLVSTVFASSQDNKHKAYKASKSSAKPTRAALPRTDKISPAFTSPTTVTTSTICVSTVDLDSLNVFDYHNDSENISASIECHDKQYNNLEGDETLAMDGEGIWSHKWDVEAEAEWELPTLQYRQLCAAFYFSNFSSFISYPTDAVMKRLQHKSLSVRNNWPDSPGIEVEDVLPNTGNTSVNAQELDSFPFMGLVDDEKYELRPEVTAPLVVEQTVAQTEVFRLESLAASIRFGDLNALRNLLKAGVNVNSLENSPLTPFIQAILSKNVAIIREIFSTKQVDPNILPRHGKDLISMTVEEIGVKCAAWILRGPIKLETRNAFAILTTLKQLKSALLWGVIAAMKESGEPNLLGALVVCAKDAVFENDLDLIRVLHSLGVPLNLKYRNAHFIHYAAVRGLNEMVNLLLECGTPVDVLTESTGVSALKIAFAEKYYDMAASLIQKGAISGLSDCFSNAVMENNLVAMQTLLNNYKTIPDFIYGDGYNLITWAVLLDRPQILQILFDANKIDLTARDLFERTIYEMEISEFSSKELKQIIRKERDLHYVLEGIC